LGSPASARRLAAVGYIGPAAIGYYLWALNHAT
jgi:hypothetical protein